MLLILKRAGTTLAAESRASKVITQAATTIKPRNENFGYFFQKKTKLFKSFKRTS